MQYSFYLERALKKLEDMLLEKNTKNLLSCQRTVEKGIML